MTVRAWQRTTWAAMRTSGLVEDWKSGFAAQVVLLQALISGNGTHEEMDRRAIACFDQALADLRLGGDDRLRQVLHDYFAWATTTTMSGYHRSADDVPDGLDILRQLGLPLDEIGEVLDGRSSIEALLARHRSYLDRQLAAIRTLRAQLTSMAAVQSGEATSVTDFVELIRKVITVDDTVKRYFSEQQLAEMAERRARHGEATIADVQAAWPELIGRVQAAVDAGVDPASPQAQKMASEWAGLLEQFHGNDEGLRDPLYRMYADNSEQIEQRHVVPPQHRSSSSKPPTRQVNDGSGGPPRAGHRGLLRMNGGIPPASAAGTARCC